MLSSVDGCQPCADGKGSEMLLAKVEAWAQGSSSAAAHLRLLSYLLQSSLAAQRQLLEDATLADRCILNQAAAAAAAVAVILCCTLHMVSPSVFKGDYHRGHCRALFLTSWWNCMPLPLSACATCCMGVHHRCMSKQCALSSSTRHNACWPNSSKTYKKKISAIMVWMAFCFNAFLECICRWASALLQLLQQALSGSDTEVVTAAVHAVSSMEPFIQHVQTDSAKYTMLETATATALQAGNR